MSEYNRAAPLPENMTDATEMSLLGCCFAAEDAYLQASEHVDADDFCLPERRALWRAMGDMYQAALWPDGWMPDAIGLAIALDNAGQMPQIKAMVMLSKVINVSADWCVTKYGAKQAAIHTHELADRRRLAAIGEGMGGNHGGPVDSGELAARAQAAIAILATKGSAVEPIQSVVKATTDEMLDGKPADEAPPYPTGLERLDELLCGGLRPGLLAVLGARPSIGKSALAHNIIAYSCACGRPVLLLTPEMGREQVLARLAAIVSRRLSVTDCREKPNMGQKGAWFVEALEAIAKWPLSIDPSRPLRLHDLTARAEAWTRAHPAGLVILDYLQLVRHTCRSREEAVAEISHGLGDVARRAGCAVLALAQLGRAAEGKMPDLADLRESGAIEADADLVLLLHRKQGGRGQSGPIDIIVAKQRDGACGTVTAQIDAPTTRFLS